MATGDQIFFIKLSKNGRGETGDHVFHARSSNRLSSWLICPQFKLSWTTGVVSSLAECSNVVVESSCNASVEEKRTSP